jgi:NAD(P)-dependent dehydrogenase (short-subunit alcohol dehydrogenase family)
MSTGRFLEGKVAVVTGAASGIGKATAEELMRHGATLHAIDCDAENLETAVREWRDAGLPAHGHAVDCADEAAVRKVADDIAEESGRIDIVHLNAGIAVGGPAETIPAAEWRRIVNVNQLAVVYGVLAFVPHLRRTAPGSALVFTSSAVGLCGFPYVAPYAMTKFAVAGLAESLAAELAPAGIHVVTVFPGMVRTRLIPTSNIDLPEPWRGKVLGLLDRVAMPPEKLARRIVKAIRKKQRTVIMLNGMGPFFWVKRLSVSLYQTLLGWGTRYLLREKK